VRFSVRQLTAADAEAFRTIRLEALLDTPEAFGGDHGEESQQPLEAFTEQLTGSAVFGGFVAEKLCGVVGLYWSQSARRRHIGNLYTVYFRPEARGQGMALPLIEAAVAHARQLGHQQVLLAAGAENAPALALYRKAGFEIYGTEPRSLYVNGRYIDEHLMVRLLDEAPGKTTK